MSYQLVFKYSATVELSQLAKSAMKSSKAKRKMFQCASLVESKPPELASLCHFSQFSCEQCSASSLSVAALRAKSLISWEPSSRNLCGHRESAGSGQRAAQITARHAARGRLAHHMCRVEICPCRMLFSRRACSEMRLIGRSTSISLRTLCDFLFSVCLLVALDVLIPI